MNATAAWVHPVKSLLACLLGLLLAFPATGADPAAELRDSGRGVIRADDLFQRERYSEINLDDEIAALGRLIESGILNPVGLAIARYWRARGYSTVNWTRVAQGEQAVAP